MTIVRTLDHNDPDFGPVWVSRYYAALDVHEDGRRLIGAPLTVAYADRTTAEAELNKLKPEYPHAYLAQYSSEPDRITPDGENLFKCQLYLGWSDRSFAHERVSGGDS